MNADGWVQADETLEELGRGGLMIIQKRQGFYVAALEEVAYRRGFITAENLREIAAPMAKNDYGKYLIALADSKG